MLQIKKLWQRFTLMLHKHWTANYLCLEFRWLLLFFELGNLHIFVFTRWSPDNLGIVKNWIKSCLMKKVCKLLIWQRYLTPILVNWRLTLTIIQLILRSSMRNILGISHRDEIIRCFRYTTAIKQWQVIEDNLNLVRHLIE